MVTVPAPAVCRKPRRESERFIAALLGCRSLLLLHRGLLGARPAGFSSSCFRVSWLPRGLQQMLLRGTPASQALNVAGCLPRVAIREIRRFLRVLVQIEESRAAGIELVDEFHRAVAQAEHAERIVGEEERHARLGIQHRSALVNPGRGQASQIEHGWSGVDQADYAPAANLPWEQARRRDEKRHVHVLVVNVERMAVVPFMLTEGFAMIAENNPERFLIEAPRTQSAHQRAQGPVAVAEGVPVPPELIAI